MNIPIATDCSVFCFTPMGVNQVYITVCRRRRDGGMRPSCLSERVRTRAHTNDAHTRTHMYSQAERELGWRAPGGAGSAG